MGVEKIDSQYICVARTTAFASQLAATLSGVSKDIESITEPVGASLLAITWSAFYATDALHAGLANQCRPRHLGHRTEGVTRTGQSQVAVVVGVMRQGLLPFAEQCLASLGR